MGSRGEIADPMVKQSTLERDKGERGVVARCDIG
jgi:hypothetical protein